MSRCLCEVAGVSKDRSRSFVSFLAGGMYCFEWCCVDVENNCTNFQVFAEINVEDGILRQHMEI